MTSHQAARLLTAANDAAKHKWTDPMDVLKDVSFQLGFAKGILFDLISAHEAPADVRDQLIKFAVARAKQAVGDGGKLA